MDIKTCKSYKPYKSVEMENVAFPDERYNKPKLTTTCRDGVWDAPHM